jgi:trigger factor
MKVSLEKEGSNVVKLGVEVEPDKARKAYDQACRLYSQRIRIPGFRPGKAPRNMVENAVGIEEIKRSALEKLVPEILHEVIFNEKLDVITEPQIESWKFELGEPLQLNAKLEVRPEVTLGDYKGLAVKVEEAKVEEGAMNQALDSIAENKASLQTTSGRPVKMGDTVLMDFECFVNGELVEGGKAEGLLLELKEGNFLEGFCEQIAGKEAGTKTEIDAKFPDNYRNTELAGKDAHFKIDVREIRERVVPEINDELAKAVGQESLEALKEALQQRIEEEIKQENETRMQRAVVDAVVANAKVDIPASMIERETNLLLAHLKRYVEQVGQSWEAFVQSPEYPETYKGKQEEARQRVLTSLVLGAVVRAESMSITNEESQPYLLELLARYNVPIEQIGQNEELKRGVEELNRQAMEEALTRKVVDFLTGQASVEYIPETKVAEETTANAK